MNSFYTERELKEIGFKSLGTDVMISRKASIYGPENMEFGDHVRIDDFTVLSGRIILGSFIHISSHVALFGGSEGIELGDYSGISSGSIVYAATDDYSGDYMSNAMAADDMRNVIKEKVCIGPYCQVGAHCVILPGANLGEGSAIGAMSLVNKPVKEWTINVGIPCKILKKRSKKMLDYLEEKEKTGK